MSSLDLILIGLMILSIIFVFQSLILPCILKYGGEKGRIAMLVVFGFITIIGYFIYQIMQWFGYDIGYIFHRVSMRNLSVIVLLMLIIALLFMFISMQISFFIIKQKEF